MWYGVSSIAARFLFYLLTPYLTLTLSSTGYGDMSIMYAAIPFLNVIFTVDSSAGDSFFISLKEIKNAEKNIKITSLLLILNSIIRSIYFFTPLLNEAFFFFCFYSF